MSSFYVAGLDLGQSQDFTALGILEVTPTNSDLAIDVPDERFGFMREERVTVEGPPVSLALRHLERVPLGTSYPNVVKHVAGTLAKVPGGCLLVIDATGVGAAVVDLFAAINFTYVAITLTGGDAIRQDGNAFWVPKRDIVHNLLVGLQEGRFTYARTLAFAKPLVKELTNFEMKINLKTAHDTYEAWRDGDHDDLVLAVGMGAWFAEREVEARAVASLDAQRSQLYGNGVSISSI